MEVYYRQLHALVSTNLTKRKKIVENEVQAALSVSSSSLSSPTDNRVRIRIPLNRSQQHHHHHHHQKPQEEKQKQQRNQLQPEILDLTREYLAAYERTAVEYLLVKFQLDAVSALMRKEPKLVESLLSRARNVSFKQLSRACRLERRLRVRTWIVRMRARGLSSRCC